MIYKAHFKGSIIPRDPFPFIMTSARFLGSGCDGGDVSLLLLMFMASIIDQNMDFFCII